MSELKWYRRFSSLAKEVASWSKDPDKQVGAVLVSLDKRQFAFGYNGFPSYVEDTASRLLDNELKNKLTVHAEMNAILNARTNLTNWSVFCTKPICHECAKAVIQAGITTVVIPPIELQSKWHDSQQLAVNLLKEAHITVKFLQEQ